MDQSPPATEADEMGGEPSRPRRGLAGLRPAGIGLAVYFATSLLAIGGTICGYELVKPRPGAVGNRGEFVSSFVKWDGNRYRQIAQNGYAYDDKRASNIAFFPAFPLAGHALADAANISTNWALLVVAHVALVGAFIFFALYLGRRCGAESAFAGFLALLAFALWPTTFFFRMAYSESLFLLTALLALYAIARRWPLLISALLVGAATATRPVGVALLPVLALECWRRGRGGSEQWAVGSMGMQGPAHGSGQWCMFGLRVGWALPLGCWGIIAFMVYQWIQFGEPLAFVQTQENYRLRRPAAFLERADSLVILEPLWTVFDPDSPCYWAKDARNSSALFNLRLGNPIYFSIAVALLLLGWWKRWLNANEIILSAGLLVIPYLTRSYEMCFCSMGRFAAVAFPLYIVMGQLLARLPLAVAGALLALSGFFMGAYAALFAAGYPLF